MNSSSVPLRPLPLPPSPPNRPLRVYNYTKVVCNAGDGILWKTFFVLLLIFNSVEIVPGYTINKFDGNTTGPVGFSVTTKRPRTSGFLAT